MANALSILPFGTQYYRAPTPQPTEWEKDLAAIKRHGFNTVKYMVVWRWCNPAPDVFRFEDIDRLMDLAAQNGLQVVLNPVFPAPAWLYRQYPDSLMETAAGELLHPRALACAAFGGFPGPCWHHAESRRARMRFLRRLVARYADHPALLCWDIGNEPELTVSVKREENPDDLTCYCENSAAAFRAWLAARYNGDIDALNARWARCYQSFEEVELPRGAGVYTDMIDWRLFMTETLTEEHALRVRTAKALDSAHPVMLHTVTIPIFPLASCGSDDYALAQHCDLFGNSLGSLPLSAAITLSAAPGKMVINSEIHAVGGSTYDRPKLNTLQDMKRHIYAPLAAGIKGFLFWQYRPERLALESPAWGLTDMEGGDTPWLLDTEKIAAALQRQADVILAAQPALETAVINSQRAQLFDFCARPGGGWYMQAVQGAHAMLRAAGYAAEVIGDVLLTPEHLARYKVLYDPFPYYKDAATCQVLRDWVAAGGTLIAECCFGGYSHDDGLHTLRQPGFGFETVFGAKELRITTAAQFLNAYGAAWAAEAENDMVQLTMAGRAYQGFHFYQALAADTAQVLAAFPDGTAAVTAGRYGKGQAVWIGTLASCAYQRGCTENVGLIAALVRRAGLTPAVAADRHGAVASLLSGDKGQLLVVDNSTDADGVTLTARTGALQGTRLEDILTGDVTPICRTAAGDSLQLTIPAGGIEAYRVR